MHHLQSGFKARLKDKSRNKEYHKIVHDYRKGLSKVYTITDDLVVVVDEDDEKIWSYGIHERLTDDELDEICSFIDSWPQADEKRCEYGISCLKSMIDNVIKQEIDNM